MSKQINTKSASSTTIVSQNKSVAKKASIEQYEREFIQLRQEINQLKDSLRVKYQELAKFKQSIVLQKKIRTKINPRAQKLNHLRLNLPNFLIIGVQKGGTTWLHENLKRHPQIFLPRGKKELEFFSYYQKKITDSGLSDYLKFFNQFEDVIQTERPKMIGEATPSYFWSTEPARQWTNSPKYFNKQIPDSVLNVLGSQLKLILCLRDPVDRAISAYFHHIKRNRISYKSQSILDVGHLYGIIDMGFYAQHLNAWLDKFRIENFKILIYEKDIKQNKQQTMEDICNFLQVDYQQYPESKDLNKYHNKGLQYRTDENGVLLIQPNGKSELVVTPDEIKQLRKIYYDDCMSLQKITNLNLSEYWNLASS